MSIRGKKVGSVRREGVGVGSEYTEVRGGNEYKGEGVGSENKGGRL